MFSTKKAPYTCRWVLSTFLKLTHSDSCNYTEYTDSELKHISDYLNLKFGCKTHLPVLQLTPVLPKGILSLYWAQVRLNCLSGIYKDWSFSVLLMVGVLGTHIAWLVLEQHTTMWLVNCLIGCPVKSRVSLVQTCLYTCTHYLRLAGLTSWVGNNRPILTYQNSP